MDDADNDNQVDNSHVPANFAARLREFIAVHSTQDDRHHLLQQIRHPTKPNGMMVQTFWYRLKELNSYIQWLPGNEPALTENQLRHSIFDGMPSSWKDRFTAAGHSLHSTTTVELVRYFRQQEAMAIRKQAENQLKPKPPGTARRNTKKGSPKGHSTHHSNNTSNKVNARSSGKRRGNGSNYGNGNFQSTEIAPSTPCPVHPGNPTCSTTQPHRSVVVSHQIAK